jgi:hypothetical protein
MNNNESKTFIEQKENPYWQDKFSNKDHIKYYKED